VWLKLAIAFLIALAASLAAGLSWLPVLRGRLAGQTIREDGPVWHSKKQGTPTLGGMFFILGIALSCLIAGYGDMVAGDFRHIFAYLFALAFAFIGFVDDWQKLINRRNLGLTALQKFLLQVAATVVFVALMLLTGHMESSLYVPFFNVSFAIPEPVYILFAAFVVVGTVNAVNITDGVDGLATGVSIPVAICFAAIAFLAANAALGVFAAALAGGLVAFLFFNFHPAKVFMGDTGALFLGGAFCALVFAMDCPLILLPLGIVFFVETLSDIIQVTYFKLTRGKRVFKMAPLHHHFEMCGWSEYRLFAVYTAVSAVFAVASFFGMQFRYK
jgi:phospho-N-acetylmuramoyl-pentapeptide-transferase